MTTLFFSAAARRSLLAGAALAACSLLSVGHVQAQTATQTQGKWPERAVTFIVPFPPGGPVDSTARLTTQPLAQLWSVATPIENKAGAGGILGAQAAAKAPADGYHFFFAAIHHSVLPSLKKNLSYDIEKDFVPVGLAARFPIVLVVNPSLPVKSVAELIAYAKANPGKLSFSSSGTGGGTHLAGELFNSMAGTTIQHIPYKGSAPAMQDLVGGQVQVMFADGPSAVPHLKGGKVRALGVGNPTRSSMLPDVATIAESGLPGYEAMPWLGFVAPAGTPAPAVNKFHAELMEVLKETAVQEKFRALGLDIIGNKPAEFSDFIKKDIVKWAKVVKDSGAKAD